MDTKKILNEAISFHTWWVPETDQAKTRSGEVVESLRKLRDYINTQDNKALKSDRATSSQCGICCRIQSHAHDCPAYGRVTPPAA